MKKLLITYAVKEELTPLTFANFNTQYIVTGIGKARIVRISCLEISPFLDEFKEPKIQELRYDGFSRIIYYEDKIIILFA